MAKNKPNPDDQLAPEQFPRMNKDFYATKPWEYFNARNHLLMLAAGASDQLYEIAREGVSYRGLNYQEKPGEGKEDSAEAKEAWEKFVMAESEVLLHHASETLLRLYLAHEPLPACPWLEVARVRSPGDFKRMLEERFLGDLSQNERRQRVAKVFFGTTDRTDVEPMPPEEDWNEGLDNIEAFLVYFARHFIAADVYNALKHGLAVRPGEASTQIDDGKLIKAEGPSIEYLSLRRNAGDRTRWHRSFTWIRPDHSMGLVYLAARLIESLWGIARLRYVKEPAGEINLWTKPSYEDAMKRLEEGEQAGVFVDSMHMELLYYIDPDAPEGPREEAA